MHSLIAFLVLFAPCRVWATAAQPQSRLAVTPDEIRTLDTRSLAEMIVGRIHRECDLAGTSDADRRLLGPDVRLVLMVPAEALDAIARDGFLNQHQTLTTGGHRRERDRFETEQELAMLRLPFDSKGRELLPKYAVVDDLSGALGTFELPIQYGDVAVVFQKKVAARATWTYADSLDYSRKTGRFDRGGVANPVLARTSRYVRRSGDQNQCGNYCEAQIWGALTLGDAEYVMIRDSEPIPDAVARLGLPIQRYSSTKPEPDQQPFSTDAEDHFQNAQQLSRLDDETLISKLERSGTAAVEPGGFSARQRLLGELATRPKTPAVTRALEAEFASSDAQTRALALYGLSELPWPELKPRLLEALGARPGPLLISAVAFAADHQDDADVAARLNALRLAPQSEATEWVERALSGRLCAARR